MELKLPYADPYFEVYPIFSNPLSILQAHKNTEGWIMNNFLQLCSNSYALNFYDFNFILCPFLIIERISKEELKSNNIDIIDFIIKCLFNQKYVYLLVNRGCISAYKPQFNDKHDISVYGVNTEKQIFYIADNFVYGKYARTVCTFDELRHAIESVDPLQEGYLGFKGCICMISFDKRDGKEFSYPRVVQSLKDYYQSVPTSLWNTMEFRNDYGVEEWYFGMDCYKYLKKRIETLSVRNCHIQDFHLLWEHKKHLQRVLYYCKSKEFIKQEIDMGILEKNIRRSLELRNILLKMKAKKIINSDALLNLLSVIEMEEKIFFEMLLPCLV